MRIQHSILTFSTAAGLLIAGSMAIAADQPGPKSPAAEAAWKFSSLSIVPQSAGFNTTRVITATFEADFNSCLPNTNPGSVRIDDTLLASAHVLKLKVVSANNPGNPVPLQCIAGLATYSLTTTFTPQLYGEIRVTLVHPDSDAVLATAMIDTQNKPKIAAKFDVTGMWYDPASNGSGLSLLHRFGGTDVAFGTWFVGPRWFSLQGAQWTQDGAVLEGVAVAVASSNCVVTGVPLTVCPSPATRADVLGSAKIVFQSATAATAVVTLNDGTELFRSSLTNLGI